MTDRISFRWANEKSAPSHRYLWPKVSSILTRLSLTIENKRLFDLGCGNGSFDALLTKAGWNVTGVDVSEEGISQARKAYTGINLNLGSAYDDLAEKYGQFPVCISLEVVEHLYSPSIFAKSLFLITEPGGHVILSTPYHGYFKNLVISLTGKWDSHFSPLKEGGHIKFWSPITLTLLLEEAGFCEIRYYFVGRIPLLAKSMIAVAKRSQ